MLEAFETVDAEPDGRSVERVEDAALLTGAGRFIDDLAVARNTGHIAILRSPEAHARIVSVDPSAALAMDGVHAVLTGEDVKALSRPLMVGVRQPMECWPLAVDRVRYVGEPVAVVVAASRYLAEDALELIEVAYDPLPVVVDPRAALKDWAVLHEAVGSNLVSERSFRYGDPEAAFEAAPHTVAVTVHYPRNAVTPIECYGVLARFDPYEGSYDVTANFQGPFSIHAVVARSLKVTSNRLRLRTPPDAGGSFGVKQAVFPYIVLVALAARAAGRPVKWVEDRLEHLSASTACTNRTTTLSAAVAQDGKIAALDWDQLEDVGAYLRAPEPATLYRMHGNMTGAYAIANVAMRNRVVVTNKTPTGLVRGFGGPQVYFALERLMHVIADRLGLDRMAVIERNLIPANAFPYRTATGALYDSGDYQALLALARAKADDHALRARRDRARAEGRLYGIGLAAVVEPSVSNMGYVSTVLTAEERARSGAKNGAQATATVALDPLGGVTVHVASVPQGQGHRTVLGQVVGDVLGLEREKISVVTDFDTGRDAWSIASGNYASRFAAAVAGAAHLAAVRLRDKLAAIAASQLNIPPEEVVFADGAVRASDNPDNQLPFERLAATSHWAPATVGDDDRQALRETVFWTPEQLGAPDDQDRVNSSLCHGFIFDICAVEVERDSGRVRIDRYVSAHDCGRILHRGMVEGQIRGGFSNAVGAALYEEYTYGEDGSFLTGTFADYLVPTAAEVADIAIVHTETPSPFTPLGAKGVGEGNCMSTPVAIANAVSDALGVPVDRLPLTPARVQALIDAPEPARPKGAVTETAAGPVGPSRGRTLSGAGSVDINASSGVLWDALFDPEALQRIVPGCRSVERLSETHFRAQVMLGVGPVRGPYTVDLKLFDLEEATSARLDGTARGALGSGEGSGHVRLVALAEGRTRMHYDYKAAVGGKVAAVGGRLLDGAARVIIGQFFRALATHAAGEADDDNRRGDTSFLRRLLRRIGLARSDG